MSEQLTGRLNGIEQLTGAMNGLYTLNGQIYKVIDGVVYIPHVSAEGIISWTNTGGLENPDEVNIKGPQGETGPTGPQGERGVRGYTGERGEQGIKGDTGAVGPQGERGEKGDKGDKGDTGKGLQILGYYDSYAALIEAVPNPEIGDAYGIGTDEPYDIYVANQNRRWVNNGPIQGPEGPQGPTGATGPSAVYIGSEEPASSDITVWIDEDEVISEFELTFVYDDGTTKTLRLYGSEVQL